MQVALLTAVSQDEDRKENPNDHHSEGLLKMVGEERGLLALKKIDIELPCIDRNLGLESNSIRYKQNRAEFSPLYFFLYIRIFLVQ